MYQKGGNAVDAAVSAALVAGVIEPTETTLAGSGLLLLHHPENGPVSCEFGPRAPLAAHPTMFKLDEVTASSNVLGLAAVEGSANVVGPLASGVPRTLLGLLTAQEQWGRLSRSDVLAPAIDAARAGFPADSWFMINALEALDVLRGHQASRDAFLDSQGLPKGRKSAMPYGISVDSAEQVAQPRLAETLETLASGSLEELTTGSIAKSLLATARDSGMLLSAADLEAAHPELVEPLHLNFRGTEVWVPAAPSGGITSLQALATWQELFPEGEQPSDRAERLDLLDQALRVSFSDRYHWLGDHEKVPVPVEALISERHAKWNASAIKAGKMARLYETGVNPPWIHYSSRAVTSPWEGYPADVRVPKWRPKSVTTPTSGTTHISASDPEGWVVSLTHTAANHFGSGVVCPRTGLLFDSAMAWFNAAPGAANSISRGARPVANMGPAILTRDGRSIAAVGASGGRRIISAVVQVIIALVEEGKSAENALRTPRIDSSGSMTVVHQLDSESFKRSHKVVVPQSSNAHELDFARANAATRDADGRCTSGIDARAYTF